MTTRREFLGGLGTLLLGACGAPTDYRKPAPATPAPGAPFHWGVGLENTWMAQADPLKDGHRLPLDEYALTQHYDRWKDDLALVADLGVTAIRYSVPWSRAEATPGEYDFSLVDAPIRHLVDDLGVMPILDLVHYGTPAWMGDGIGDARFPDSLATYADAIANHFRGSVTSYTPLNEPSVSAWSSGWAGIWPPYARAAESWAALGVRIARAMVLASQSLRAALPGVTLISADAASLDLAAKIFPGVAVDDDLAFAVGTFPACLAYGKVAPDSRLAQLLVKLGVSPADLQWLLDNAAPPDVLGLNRYPDFDDFPNSKDFTRGGALPLDEAAREAASRVESVLRRAHAYFDRPVYLSETSAGIAPTSRAAYATAVGDLVQRLRAEGFPIVGANWWPLIEAAAWAYREHPELPLTAFLVPGAWNNALYDLAPHDDGSLERVETVAAAAWRDVIAGHRQI